MAGKSKVKELSFSCPQCHRVPPSDAHKQQGYCDACRDWTRTPTTSEIRAEQVERNLRRFGQRDYPGGYVRGEW